MSVNQSQHRHIDMNLAAAKALPGAGATAYTDGLDTRSGGTDIPVAGSQTVDLQGNAALNETEVMVEIDATTTLVDGKLITVGLQSSTDDGGSDAYAAIAGITTQTVTGATGNGSAKTQLRWKLPSGVERYIRASAAIPADGGTNTAFNFTLYILT